jgi:hypothetical protein
MIQRFKPNHHNWTDLLHEARTHTHTHTHTHIQPFIVVRLSLAMISVMFVALRDRRRQVELSVSSSMEQNEAKLSSIQQNSTGGKGPLGYCQSLLTGSVSLYQTATVSVHCLPKEERLRSTSNSMVALRTPEKKHVARCLF